MYAFELPKERIFFQIYSTAVIEMCWVYIYRQKHMQISGEEKKRATVTNKIVSGFVFFGDLHYSYIHWRIYVL